MKSLYRKLYVLLGMVSFVLAACQSATARVSCEPVTDPWPLESFAVPNEYYAGYFPNVTISRVCTIVGSVEKDHLYRQAIIDDLTFCLDPNLSGWTIGITNYNDVECEMNFSSPVTLPRHGWNPRYIEGSYFATGDHWNETNREKNLPAAVREFNFIFSSEDYEKIEQNYDCWRYGLNCPTDWDDTSETPRSRGIFTITNMELGDLKAENDAWIESMAFEVKIYLPAE